MMSRKQQNRLVPAAMLLAALVGGMVVVPGLRAQTAERKLDSRFLFVFDTSAEMKHRVKAVQTAINGLLATSANGQLHSNNTIGIWTFDQDLKTGQFPLQRWNPDQAVQTASNITTFVAGRRYAKKTGFDALLPLLNQVVQGSERLTVVIFCDGYGEFRGTPYDVGINQVFKQRQGERQKARLPIVIVLYSQLGQFVDCMVSFPPQPVDFPEFPPLPAVVAATPKAAPAPAPARPSVPPLIVIGTPVTNRALPPAPKPGPTLPSPLATTSSSAPAVAPEARPLDDVPLTRPSAIPGQLKISPGLLPGTNGISGSSEKTGIGRGQAFGYGLASLVVVGVLVFLYGRIRAATKG